MTEISPETRRPRLLAALYGAACHGLFALAVASMIVAMFFGMSESFGRVPEPWAWLANAALIAQFPAAHSLLLSRRGAAVLGRLAPRRLGAGLATTTYVIVASLQVFVLFAFWTPSGVVWWRAEGVLFSLIVACYALAWLLLLKAIFDAGVALQTGLLGWWAVFRDRAPVFPPMPTRGLFRVVRQPIYVAFALTLWTVPTWTPDQLAVAVTLTGYCLAGPLLKERRFERRYGSAFRGYARRVPYWLPFLPATALRNDLSIYGDGAAWWRGDTPWLRALRNLVPARMAHFDPIVATWRGRAVLDLGCGGGFMAEALAERGARVVGVDPSAAAVAAAARHAAASGHDIAYHVARGEHLPLPDADFDVVVCVDVLEHVADLDRVLAEIRRVLRPGGLFLFDTINRNPLAAFVMVGVAERLIRLLPPGTHDPDLFIGPQTLRRKLAETGFAPGAFAGLGPRGWSRTGGFTFGRLPTLWVQYIGHARAI